MATAPTVIGRARQRAPGTPAPAPAPAPGTPPHQRGPQPPPAPTAPAQDPLDYYQSLIQGLPPSSASLISIEARLAERGITVMRNARGIAGKIKLPSGEIVDVGQNFGSPRPETMRWQILRSDRRYENGVLIGAPPAGTTPAPPGAATPRGTVAGGGLRRGPGSTTTGEQAVPRGTFGLPPFPAAYEAARRQRLRGGVGGRGSTILGGFTPGTPRTRPATILGR